MDGAGRTGHSLLGIASFATSFVPGTLLAGSYLLLLEFPHFVMERRMLLGIKERAERARMSR
jgi:hypothetical protein